MMQQRKPSRLRTVLRRMAFTLGGLLAGLILIVAVVLVFEIPINLSLLRGPIEAAASEALGRRFAIEGPLTLLPTAPPAVQIEAVHVGNPESWPEADLASLDLARARVAVLPLLAGEVRIEEIAVEGLGVNLETNADGEPNWLVGKPAEKPEAEPPPSEQAPSPSALEYLELKELALRDIAITYRATDSDKPVEFIVETVSGSAIDQEPLQLAIEGTLQQAPYTVELNAGSLTALLEGNTPWPLELTAKAVGATLNITGEIADPLHGKGINLQFDLNGPTMNELEAMLGTRLPPIGSFGLKGQVEEVEGKYRLTDLKGDVATAQLDGSFEADLSGQRPRLSGKLLVQRIDAGPFFAAVGGDEIEPSEQGQPSADPQPPAAARPATALDPDQPVLVLDALNNFDAEFKLSVGEVINAPTSLRDATFQVTVADGKLSAPVTVTVAEVGFNGEASLTPGDDGPEVAVSLAAKASDIGDLAQVLTGATGIEGQFGNAELSLSARGETIRSLTQTAALKFNMVDAALSYGHEPGGRPVEFTLENADMVFPAADDSQITAQGSLLGEPFSLSLAGGTFLDNIVKRRWPIELTATGGGAELNLDGAVDGSEAGIRFDVGGESIGGLARWLGVSPQAAAPYRLSGEVTIDSTGFKTRLSEAHLGATTAAGEVGVRREGDRRIPFAKLEIDTIDVEELSGLFPKAEQEPSQQQGQDDKPARADKAFTIDLPILPRGIELFDADIAITIERIEMAPAEVGKVSLSTEIRDGYVEQAPLGAVIGDIAVAGNFSADLRGDSPEINFAVQSDQVNVGELLRQLGVASGLEATAGQLELSLAMKGASTREILEQSAFTAQLRDALWRLRGPGSEGGLAIAIPEGTIKAEADKPITLVLDGRIGITPVNITIEADSLASFAKPKDSLGMALNIALANAELKLTGTAPLPVQAQNLAFTMDLNGNRLSDFNPLLGVSLPPYGPYRWSGQFGTRQASYYVENLKVELGESTLSGALQLDAGQQPPQLTVDLAAQSIQLDDFDTAGWTPTAGGGPPAPSAQVGASSEARGTVQLDKIMRLRIQQELVRLGYDTGGTDAIFGTKTRKSIRAFQQSRGLPVTGEADPEFVAALLGTPNTQAAAVETPSADTPSGGEAADAELAAAETPARAAKPATGAKTAGGSPALLSPAVLRRLNGTVTVKVQEVVSGQDQLGQGQLVATLQDGRLTVEPLTVAVPGGSVDVAFGYHPSEAGIALTARAKVEQLDYGILARRIDPQSEVGGLISVDIDVNTREQPGKLMAAANGHIDFAVWPKDLNAGIFDLWAVNLVTSLMPALDGEADSKLNCIIARFGINNGLMTPTALLIDSTRIQASGDGMIDLKGGAIEFKAAPRSKSPQMFSAKTPVEVGGKLTDFKVGLPPGALAGTAIRVLSSPVTVPFQWVFSKKPEPDGKVACERAWSYQGGD